MDIEAFARERIAPRDLRAEPEFPHDLWRSMAEAGLFRIGLDGAHGGDGGGYAPIAEGEAALIRGGGSPGLGSAWASHQMVARTFLSAEFATPSQRGGYLPALASGRITASVAISEPGAGAHPKHLRATAERRGASVVLNGEKAYITNGPIADLFIVFAITAVEGGRKRYGAFLVPHDTPGLERVAMRGVEAYRPALHCGLRLTDCVVPAGNQLGPTDAAYEKMALPFRDVEDAVGGAGLVGSIAHLLLRLGQIAVASPSAEDTATLGSLVALSALVARGAQAAVRELDADPGASPDTATLVGLRVLAAEILARARQFHEARGPDDPRVVAILDFLQASLSVARTARLARQTRLGEALLRSGHGATKETC